MATIPQYTLIHGDAADHAQAAELLFTDPPYELAGDKLASILRPYQCDHLVLITTMRQLLNFMRASDWELSFDFVIDGVAPKKSRNIQQPNYTHQTGVYLTRNGAKSRFDRKRRQRADVFEANGYWPTIFHAPRQQMQEHGHAKNLQAMTDIIASFDVQHVCDPFLGSGTTMLAAFDLDISCTGIEKDSEQFARLRKAIRFVGGAYNNLRVIT